MNLNDKHRIEQIELRLSRARHSLEALHPVWNQVDRRVKDLDGEIKRLEDERMKLQQGQLTMSFENLEF